jgi:DNA-binding transcriptional LysR family regulator
MLSMRALDCLVAIAEQSSLTQEAAVLHMSHPALSHQIAAIERELGTSVVERLPRRIRPTAAGLAAAAEARVALAGRAVMIAKRVAAGWWPHENSLLRQRNDPTTSACISQGRNQPNCRPG